MNARFEFRPWEKVRERKHSFVQTIYRIEALDDKLGDEFLNWTTENFQTIIDNWRMPDQNFN